MSKQESNQTEEKYQTEMGKTSHPMLPGETNGSVHVLQQAGGLLPAHLGPQVLSLNTETVWGTFPKSSSRTKKCQRT